MKRKIRILRNMAQDRMEAQDRARYEATTPLDLSDVPADVLDNFADRFHPGRVAPDRWANPQEILFFIHIPKTAGMSLGRTFQEAFDVFRPVQWDRTQESFREEAKAALETPEAGRQVVIGHYGWRMVQELVDAGQPVQCGSFVRDPAQRLASNYDYNRSPAHPRAAEFSRKFPTFDAFVESVPANFQSIRLAGEGQDLVGVLETLNAHYSFLGLTEAFGASLNHLGRSHGLSGLSEFTENLARSDKTRTRITKAMRARIYEKHSVDLRLVRLLKQFYGLS